MTLLIALQHYAVGLGRTE